VKPYSDAFADKRKTPVGMTAPLLSRNEVLYPSPMTFDPDRFLKNPRLDRYQLSFSRGSRRCLGVSIRARESMCTDI
jgi:cytochrome P450